MAKALLLPLMGMVLLGWTNGALIIKNFTLRHTIDVEQDPSIGKVLLFMTAAVHSKLKTDHLSDLSHLWPIVLRKNLLLRSADVIVYVGVGRKDRAYASNMHALERSVQSFPNSYIRVFIVENPGYQRGAIEAMADGVLQHWFDGYSWSG